MVEQVSGPGGEPGLWDAQGRFVPERLIKDVDAQRHSLVLEIVERAKRQSAALTQFKARMMADIQAFLELSAEEYGAKYSSKGNVMLQSFDGRYRVQRAVADYLVFDERLQVAKDLVDECIREWSEGSRAEIRTLVEHAFQVDHQGQVSTGRVLGLRKLKITDERWRQAMRSISDSVQVCSSKSYVRVYERVGSSDEYRQIPLDVAAV